MLYKQSRYDLTHEEDIKPRDTIVRQQKAVLKGHELHKFTRIKEFIILLFC